MTTRRLALRQSDGDAIRAHLFEAGALSERVLFLTLRRSKSENLDGEPVVIYTLRSIFPVEAGSTSASRSHVTWDSGDLIPMLKQAATQGLTVGIAHSHLAFPAVFSNQDNVGESGLIEFIQHRNGPDAELVSLVYSDEGSHAGRVWLKPSLADDFAQIVEVGLRYQYSFKDRGDASAGQQEVLARQALAFGEELNRTISLMTFGIVGCGGTGSAVAMLLARLGGKHFLLIDPDKVEFTNLNRLHGATRADAEHGRPKVDVVGAHVQSIEPSAKVVSHACPVNDARVWPHLKACDVIFGCTDDNRGRVLLNRLAYFYLLPVIDLGLAIELSRTTPARVLSLDGRVSCLGPGEVCLLCRGVINTRLAREEALRAADPAEYARQKEEAYVIGEGDPSPSVVTFTTEVATMAANELIHRLQGFRGPNGATGSRTRQFHRNHDLRPGDKSDPDCPICADRAYWGLGDTTPFLDQVW